MSIQIPKTIAGLLLLTAASATAGDLPNNWIPQVSPLKEYRSIGGSGNNANPRLNPLPYTPELALTPLNFKRGPGNQMVDGPNPRYISNQISGATDAKGVELAEATDPVVSAWIYVFGQFLDHDIDLEETPQTNDPIPITIAQNDPEFPGGGTIAMYRDTRGKTNTIINTTAGFLDLSQLYGSDATTAASLRKADGTLKTSHGGTALPTVVAGSPPKNYFITGDPRVMENPELTAVTILFMREHNFWVDILKNQHPNWSGDQLYNMAKAINTAEYQNIVYKEYLPALLGPSALGPYRGYNPNVNAQATQEFSTAAFRVGHSQVSDTQEGIDNTGAEVFSQPLAEAFFNSADDDVTNGINPLLRSLGVDFSQATDAYAVGALRNLLVAGLVGGAVDKIDLIAIDIQRQRDVGLGTLNQTRKALGMDPYTSYDKLTSDGNLAANLQIVYGHNGIDNVDLFIGGLAENHAQGAIVGPTFQAIIAEQFEALRAGDRLFWLNEGFDQATSWMISNTTLAKLIQRNASTPNLQANVFIQANLPAPHRWHHDAAPSIINGSGRPNPFTHDGM